MSKVKSTFKYIIFAVVLLIPFIYSFFYLKAYWDPYGNMDNIPVALVNEDSGEKGAKVVDKLTEQHVLDFETVDSAAAEDGLLNKKYYATITFPATFTSDLESASSAEKTPAQIKYAPNQKSNYLASQIINRVVLSVERSVRSEVTSSVVSTLSDKLEQVPQQLQQVESGVSQLQSGANQLNNGLNTLDSKYLLFDNGIATVSTGSAKLSNGLVALNSGLNTLHSGASALNDGVSQINSALAGVDTAKLTQLASGVQELNTGATKLSAGAADLSSQVSQYTTGAEQLATGLETLDSSLAQQISELSSQAATLQAALSNATALHLTPAQVSEYTAQLTQAKVAIATLQQIQSSDGYQALVAGAAKLTDTSTYGVTPGQALSTGASSLSTGASQLTDGTTQLVAGVSELSTFSTQLNTLKEKLVEVGTGTSSLVAGVEQLQAGSSSATSGSSALTAGLSELQANSTSVKDGISTLDDGSATLANGVSTLQNAVSQGADTATTQLQQLDGLAEFAADPVEITEEPVGEVDAYGTSFTPLFLSIGLWVGALMAFVVLYFDQDHRFGIFDKENRSLKQAFAYIGVAAGYGLVTAFLVKTLIGFSVTSVFGYYAGAVVIAATFMAIIQCFITLFGDIGKFLALIVLVLQLAAAGGTFPIETVFSGFRWLNPLLPMTYSINLVKEDVISTTGNFAWDNTLVLLGFFAVNLAITVAYYCFFYHPAHAKTTVKRRR